jgi:hypothetical protein
MHPAFDLVKCFNEVPYGEALTETPKPFFTLPVVPEGPSVSLVAMKT